jgi:hypothetical protein
VTARLADPRVANMGGAAVLGLAAGRLTGRPFVSCPITAQPR